MLEEDARENHFFNLTLSLCTTHLTGELRYGYVSDRVGIRLFALEFYRRFRGNKVIPELLCILTGTTMITQQLLDTALKGLDRLGFRLDQYGITGKLNRHNLTAFIAQEQKHLEGEWDSIQVRFDRRRSQVEGVLAAFEARTDPLVKPLISRFNQLRGASGN